MRGPNLSHDRKPVLTGGCQCGAVRYACYAEPVSIGLCHCRMCQKAVAGPFASLAEVKRDDFAWTRGEPKSFRSSSLAARDFCAACGTPLSYREIDGPIIELLTGSFDDPRRVVPTCQVGVESRLDWLAGIAELLARTTSENTGAAKAATIVSYQHPDHDTRDGWSPPHEKSRENR